MGKWIMLAGRICFSIIFIHAGLVGHILNLSREAHMAAAKGLPAAAFLVFVTGLMSLAGGLSILLGWRTGAGAWLVVLFLVPVTLIMHWPASNPAQWGQFMKNLGLVGGALFLAVHGPGPLSVDKQALFRQAGGK